MGQPAEAERTNGGGHAPYKPGSSKGAPFDAIAANPFSTPPPRMRRGPPSAKMHITWAGGTQSSGESNTQRQLRIGFRLRPRVRRAPLFLQRAGLRAAGR